MVSRRAFTAGLLGAPLALLAGTEPADAASADVWIIGDSISAGGYLTATGDADSNGWAFQVACKAAKVGTVVQNFAVGGMALHSPTGSTNTGMNRARALFAQGRPVPQTVVVALGTNDVIAHTLAGDNTTPNFLPYVLYAALDLEAYLKAQGVQRVVWCSVPPVAAHNDPTSWGGYIYYFWVPEIMARVDYVNGWLWSTFGGEGRVVDNTSTLRDWADVHAGKPSLFLDGLHPTREGHDRLAAGFPISTL